ncbi:MAG: hypothetical protein B7Y56_14155 [Gallionellales bacterium 35-53-114]|jgi:hypothetical protein|nr:MAG: hypothetical protein B7Y56_14155 [Gallionellales bacterium 35-53-114]OYZ62349.1 MAG: hypothetical protein B7Y04_14405 [Gallionellales bacterium 24-53-125]OZB07389.1 MAG: hypothetical protein B7X61_14825 [Gallionellales bacterium 39-52-133]HQS59562.1 hypothetical protein [Gallionellaceae bacterium]HQS75535.1 hypothetical protein [Gallionellaceae bacterium]
MENNSAQKESQQAPFVYSRKIIGIAVLLWAVSMLLPGLVLYGKNGYSPGITILLMGWIGILGSYVAWYANIFWLIAIIRLLGGKVSGATNAFVAALLSLDTFRFEDVSMGGPHQYVYGIAIGGILWMTAIFLTMFATSLREIEITNNNLSQIIQRTKSYKEKISALFILAQNNGKQFHLVASTILLTGFLGLTATLAVYDRVVGNQDERDKLNHELGVFKRSEICSQSPKPVNQILIDGPLELINPDGYRILKPEELLAMGVPVVRDSIGPNSYKGTYSSARDYYLVDKQNPESLQIRKPEGNAVARLEIKKLPSIKGAGDSSARMVPVYHITLISKRGDVGFDQIWMKQYMHNYCPNLYKYSEKHYSLEKLIRQTIIFPKPAVQ